MAKEKVTTEGTDTDTANSQALVNSPAPASAAVAVASATDDQFLMQMSQEETDRLLRELNESLYQAEQGFGQLTKPSEIAASEQAFTIIDAATINNFLDTATGEESVKHVFRLQFDDGRVAQIMQSNSRPREVLADCFIKARALGARLAMGPYKLVAKAGKQIQPALIFEQQSGWRRDLRAA